MTQKPLADPYLHIVQLPLCTDHNYAMGYRLKFTSGVGMRGFSLCIGSLLLWSAFLNSHAAAQAGTQKGQNRLSGEISFEGTEGATVSILKQAEVGIEKWSDELLSAVKGGGGISNLDDPTITHLNAFYLYCMQKIGACQFVLDTILETDVIQSRGTGKAECPTMSRFWKLWVRDEMEKRAKYLVTVGNAPGVAQFNLAVRPKYIKCKEMVATAAAEASSSRYAEGSATKQAISRFMELRSQITTKNIDIFSSIGFKFPQKKRDE